MDSKTTNILYYCTFIGWLVAVVAGDQNGSSSLHKNQGFVLCLVHVIITAIGNVFWAVPVLGTIIGIAGNIIGVVLLVIMILGIVNAANNQEKELPIVSAIKIF